MILVYLAIVLWVAVISAKAISALIRWLTTRHPINATDLYCASADARLDELEARRALRPTGSCEVIQFPRRGDAA